MFCSLNHGLTLKLFSAGYLKSNKLFFFFSFFSSALNSLAWWRCCCRCMPWPFKIFQIHFHFKTAITYKRGNLWCLAHIRLFTIIVESAVWSGECRCFFFVSVLDCVVVEEMMVRDAERLILHSLCFICASSVLGSQQCGCPSVLSVKASALPFSQLAKS